MRLYRAFGLKNFQIQNAPKGRHDQSLVTRLQLFKRWIALSIHWINHYPLDNSISFGSVYLLDSDLSGGQRYPSFEQLWPGARSSVVRVKFENVYPQSDLGWQCDDILKLQSSQTIGDVKEFEQANMFRRN